MAKTDLDLSSAQSTRKALHDIHDRQKTLAARNDDLREQLDKKASDLSAVQKRLSEIESASKMTVTREGDASLGKYVRRDGTVRMRGESTDECAYLPGLLDDAPRSDWQADFQNAIDDHNLMKVIRKGKGCPKTESRVHEIGRRSPVPEVARIFADSGNVGAEWIPDVTLPLLERTLTSSRRLAANFETFNMTDKNVVLPFLTTGFRPYIKAAATTDDPAQFTSSSMVTNQRVITATGFAVRAQVDADSSEDSILAALPLIRSEVVAAIIDGEEDAIINGDTGTHQDDASGVLASWNARSRWGASGLGTSADHRRAWIGLRARAYDVGATDEQGGEENFAGLMTLRGARDAPHGTEGDVIGITSPEVYITDIMAMDEVLTLEKVGPQAVILSGQVASIAGMPVVVSDFVTKDLHTTGLFTTANTTSGWLICNRSRFKIGRLAGGAGVELDKDITRGVYDVVATSREVFFTVDPAASVKNVAWGYNLLG